MYIDGFAILIVAVLLLVSGAVMLSQSQRNRALTRIVCRVLAYVNMNQIPYQVPTLGRESFTLGNHTVPSTIMKSASPNFSNALNDLWIAVGCPRPRPANGSVLSWDEFNKAVKGGD